MGLKLWDELTTSSAPKLSLSVLSLPSHKPALEPLGVLTPPLHPMISVPFKWEEVPGRPKNNTIGSNPSRPICGQSLELDLPPRLLKLTKVPLCPNGPQLGRAVSDRFCFHGRESTHVGLELQGTRDNNLRAHIMSCRWPNQQLAQWDIGGHTNCKGRFDSLHSHGVANDDINMKLKIRRCKSRSNGSLHKLSHKSYCLLESIYKSLKRAVVRKHKEEQEERGAS